jgi:hypothetical protein
MKTRSAELPAHRISFYHCIVISLLLCFFLPKNGDALPAAMGAAAKRACRLQERRSLCRAISCSAEALPA